MLPFLLFGYSLLLPSWKLQILDRTAARTTIRLWHELHVCTHVAHDFVDMLGRERDDEIFIATVAHDEIRAIAKCRRKNISSVHVCRIAHSPQNEIAGYVLLTMLIDANATMEWDQLRLQKRWLVAALFHTE